MDVLTNRDYGCKMFKSSEQLNGHVPFLEFNLRALQSLHNVIESESAGPSKAFDNTTIIVSRRGIGMDGQKHLHHFGVPSLNSVHESSLAPLDFLMFM